jgi:hypothetical protein
MPGVQVSLTFNPPDFAEQMEKALGTERMDKVLLEVTQKVSELTAERMRTNYKTAGIKVHHPADGLYASIRKKRIRKQYSAIGYWVGPLSKTKRVVRAFAPDVRQVVYWGVHRHLIEFGHRIVTHSGRDTGNRTRAFPFIGPAFEFAQQRMDVVVGEKLKQAIDSSAPIGPK